MFSEKNLKKCIYYLSFLLFISEQISTHPIDTTADEEYLDNELQHYYKRFTRILKNADAKYATDIENLIKLFQQTIESSDLAAKAALYEHYTARLDDDFIAYLQLRLDEQYLNEDIQIETWYLRQLMQQVDNGLATEIAELLPRYQQALNAVDFDEKYEIFTSIEAHVSDNLLAIIDADPETLEMLNVHLQFFRQFLLYLGARDGDVYGKEVQMLLDDVDRVLATGTRAQKLRILDRFDDTHTKFGRYLNFKVIEFEIDEFGV